MQKLVSFFLTVLFILPIVFVLSSESKAQEVEEKLVVIKGTDDWKNTRVRIYPADDVTIRASGEICFSTATCTGETGGAIVDADGWAWNTYKDDWPGDYTYCFDPLSRVNHAALIGNVGSDDFLIGTEANFTGKDGFLYLTTNDCTKTGDYGNSGQFEVYIKVIHIK